MENFECVYKRKATTQKKTDWDMFYHKENRFYKDHVDQIGLENI